MRPWKSARRCSACLYPNDSDANYCQACGTSTGLHLAVTSTVRVDETAIKERFKKFQSVIRSNPYQRQKSALEQQLSQFLGALTPPRTVTSCTASDIVNFLIFKDKSGRTVVHSSLCSRASCTCPKRLAAGSVDSLIGRLRAVFNNLGRLNNSNPVAHPLVKDYLKFVRQEQAGLAITPVQAVPLFFDKFRRLIAFLRGLLLSHAPLSRSGKYILVRDATFFVVDFFTGDRASDLGRLQSCNIFRLRDREGFLLKFTLTRNIRKGSPRSFALIKFTHPEVCPVAWVQHYITVCQCLKISLDQGYFFRATERDGSVGDKPFTGSAVNNRLRKHLLESKLHAGETPHSFRVGLSNTLRLLGCSQEEVAQYLGWKSGEVASRYMQRSHADASLTILESVFPRVASGLVTPVSHPNNLDAAV